MTNEVAHEHYIRRCIELARQAVLTNDTPVASLIVSGDQVIAEGVEAVRGTCDVTAHAEIQVLRAAFVRLGSLDLTGCTLYTSVEPCIMCAYAIRLARVSTVVSGARPEDVSDRISGYTVLSDVHILPTRAVPLLIRDVLERECRALFAQPRLVP
ncbi:MAG TPA: nucleoside deaminase [Bryobacteraceae bacterium]|jgi:tRNA(adenine34) deaminase